MACSLPPPGPLKAPQGRPFPGRDAEPGGWRTLSMWAAPVGLGVLPAGRRRPASPAVPLLPGLSPGRSCAPPALSGFHLLYVPSLEPLACPLRV